MRKIVLSLGAAALCFSCAIKSIGVDGKDGEAGRSQYKVNAESVAASLKYLSSDELKGRDSGSPELEKAATYVNNIFEQYDVKPYFVSYNDTLTNFEKTTYNVLGVVEGNDPELSKEYIVIGAHYDHIGVQKGENGDVIANGANDNASGSVAVIEMAKYFGRAKSNKRSLIFALFSAEEKGLLGSKHMAKRLKLQGLNLYAMLNFEMIGVPLKGKDYVAYATGFDKSNVAAKLNEYAGEKLVGFLPNAKKFNLFQRSDNFPFDTEFKVPSHTFCTFDFTNFDHYHKVGDEFELMDVNHMTQMIQKFTKVIEKMSNTSEREIIYN